MPDGTDTVLLARGARIVSETEVFAIGLEVSTKGRRVGLVGDWSPLVRVLTGDAWVACGSLTLLDQAAETVLRTRRVGFAGARASLPGRWRTEEYLATSGRLVGLARGAAARTADEVFETLGLNVLRKRRLDGLTSAERRALVIAHGTVGDPPLLFVDGAFQGLSDREKTWLAEVIDHASERRALVFTTGEPALCGPEAALLARMDHVAIMAHGTVVASGPPEDILKSSRTCVVRATRSPAAFALALAEKGAEVVSVGKSDATGEVTFAVVLPEGGTPTLIVEAALATSAPLIEMRPIGFEIPD